LIKSIIDEAVVAHKKDDGIILVWNDIRWSNSFPEIKLMINAIDHLEYDDYSYLEVGEDYSDVTTKGGWSENPFNLCLMRDIYYEE
jgi:hypothetical protein